MSTAADPEAHAFHEFAYRHHLEVLVRTAHQLAASPDGGDMRLAKVAAADLIKWVVAWASDVHDGEALVTKAAIHAEEGRCPDPLDLVDVLRGATWARHEFTHGRANLVRLAVEPISSSGDVSSNSRDVLGSDPEVLSSGSGETPTLRFGSRPHSSLKSVHLECFYDTCVAGRRVIVVAGLLADWARHET